MDYGEVLTKAWRIIWKFKVLWIFGILSSCGENSRGSNPLIRYSFGESDFPPGMRNFSRGFRYFFNNIQAWQIAALMIGFLLFILLMVLIFSAINTVGRVGLIRGTVKADSSAEKLTFSELFNDVKPFFWRVFAFNFLAGVAVMVMVILLVIPLTVIGVLTAGIALVCLIPLICLLVPLSWLVGVVFEQVNIAIVVEDLDIIAGLKRGWVVFRDNIGTMLVMAVILVLGGAILTFILVLPVISITIPVAVSVIAAFESGSELLYGGGVATAFLCFGIYFPLLIILGGILQAYIKTAWTLTFLRLTNPAKTTLESEQIEAEGSE